MPDLKLKEQSKIFFDSFFKSVIPILIIILLSSLLYQSGISKVILNAQIDKFWYSILSASIPTIMYGLFTFLYIYVFDKRDLIHTSNFHISMIGSILISLVGLLSFNVIVTLLFELLNLEIGTNAIIELGSSLDPIYYIYLIPVMILFVGPIEEIMVRGIIQGSFRQNFTKNKSIIITSFIFGLLHIIAVDGLIQTTTYVVSTFVLSTILGYVYERTESIAVPSIVHGLYNSALVTSLYIAETGIIDSMPIF